MSQGKSVTINKVDRGFIMNIYEGDDFLGAKTHEQKVFHDSEETELIQTITELFGLKCVDWSDDDKKEVPANKQLDENSV